MNRRLRGVPGFVILLAWMAAAGCGDEPLGPEAKSLATARARWESAGLEDYAYTYRMSCFCPPQLLENARVSVSEGKVSAVQLLESDIPAPPETYDVYATIDDLFDRLARDLASDPAVFEVTYDASLGYPTSARIDISEQIADEEYSFAASDLVPATP
ncbi:MAG: DUF6174 domain-containing protein [Candidatus Palauibacterales bacterium]|nr:DUF6174 domain-containing protein [Candidatus Palauibacterales bacterium]